MNKVITNSDKPRLLWGASYAVEDGEKVIKHYARKYLSDMEITQDGKTNEIPIGETPNAAAKESGTSGY